MIPASDKLFAQYQQSGDPADLAAVFDLTAPKLLLLAIHLTGDELGAEDLVQNTFVKLIENASSYDPNRPFLPWAGTILSNEARQAWRRSRQADAFDPLVREVSDDPLRIAAEADTIEVLTEAIDGLDEKFRAVVRLKVVHGMKPGEIANVLSISPELARTRLSRGLKQLRAALPPALAGSLMIMISGRGLAQVRTRVLERAAATRPVTTATGSVSIATFVWIGAVLSALVGLTAWFAPTSEDVSATADLDSNAQPAAHHPLAQASPPSSFDAPARRAIVDVQAADAQSMKNDAIDAPWMLSGTVYTTDSRPLAGATVRASILHGCDLEPLAPCVSASDGTYVFDVDALRRLGDLGLLGAALLIEASAPNHRPAPVDVIDAMPESCESEAQFVHDLYLIPGRSLRATLHSPLRIPIQGSSSARLVDQHDSRSRSWIHFESGDEIQLAVLGDGPWRFEVQCDEGILSLPVHQLPHDQDLGVQVVREHGVVQGRLVVQGEHPVPHAMFHLQRVDAADSLESNGSRQDEFVAPAASKRGRSGADGRFRVTGLLDGTYRLELEHGAIEPAMAVVTTGEAGRDILLNGQSLTVRTVDAQDRLVPGLTLRFEWELDGEQHTGDLGINDQGGVFDFLIPIGSKWRFASGNWQVHFDPVEHFATASEPHAELTIPVEQRTATGHLRLQVRDPSGSPIDHFEVELHHLDSDDRTPAITARELASTPLPVGRYLARLTCPGDAPDDATIFLPFEFELQIGSAAATRTVEVALGGRVEVALTAPADRLDTSRLYMQVFADGTWQQVGGFTQRNGPLRETPASFDFARSVRSIVVFPTGALQFRLVSGAEVSSTAQCVVPAGSIVETAAYFERH